MSGDFHERLEEAARPMPSDRSCGLAVAALCLILAWFLRAHAAVAEVLVGLAALLAVLALVRPSLLHPLARGWVALGGVLHKVIGPVVMGVLYFGIVTPFGFAMRIWYDPLSRKRLADKDTYWAEVAARNDASCMLDQF